MIDLKNGYGSYQRCVESAANALLFIDLLGEKNISSVSEVYPNPNGTITFEWSNSSDEVLSLEIGKNSMSYFVEVSGQKPYYADEKLIVPNEVKTAAQYISILHKKQYN